MKRLLFVDDSEDFLNLLMDFFKDYSDEFTVFSAANGKDAVEIVDSMPIDLVLTDIKMPEMDGFALMSYLNRKHKNIPIIVMTGHGTGAMENLVKLYGGVHYLQKPLDLNATLNLIRGQLKDTVKGFVRGISLPSLLQIIEMEQKTCTVIAVDDEDKGCLYFEGGILIDAEKDGVKGKEAAYQILRANNIEIQIEDEKEKRSKTIDVPIMHLLLESTRINDEKNARNLGIGDSAISEQEKNKFDNFFFLKNKEKEKCRALEQRVLFDEISKIDGFIAGAIFFTDGEVLISKTSHSIDVLQLGALCNELSLVAMSVAEKVKNTSLSFLDVRTDKYNYLHYYVIQNLVGLCVIAEHETNIAELKNHSDRIADIIKKEFTG